MRVARLERQAGHSKSAKERITSDFLYSLLSKEMPRGLRKEEDLTTTDPGLIKMDSLDSGKEAGQIFAGHLLEGQSIEITDVRVRNLGGFVVILSKNGGIIGVDGIWQKAFRQGFKRSEPVNDMLLGVREQAANYDVRYPDVNKLAEKIVFRLDTNKVVISLK